MIGDNTPTGVLYSRLYARPAERLPDSKRFRTRLYGHYTTELFSIIPPKNLFQKLRTSLGITIKYSISYTGSYYNIEDFFIEASTRDFLDTITIIWMELHPHHSAQTRWHSFAALAMAEEHLAYRLDEKCGVHPLIDSEFEKSRALTLECLAHASLAAARAEYDEAHGALAMRPPDTKKAVRCVFEATEIVLKQLVPGDRVKRLEATEITKHVRPWGEAAYAGNAPALTSVNQFLEGMSNWISSVHQYRHGQAVEEPSPPPLELAVALMSAGSGYIRLLVDLAKKAGALR